MAETFIVADAGGTGTQWRVVNGADIQQMESSGFNAFTHDLDIFLSEVYELFHGAPVSGIPVFFYAAGADTPQQQRDIAEGLSKIFNAPVQVQNDLLGVARSLCGKEPGYVGILGTGSNACFYDGTQVSKVSASLGYVLGDEGSGAYLGKSLLKAVYRERLSPDLLHAFQEKYSLPAYEAIRRVYQPHANHFLASFAPFIFEHRHHPDMFQLVSESFQAFFDAFFCEAPLDQSPFCFSGSIAYYFADILRQVAADKKIFIKTIVQSPIAGLVLYHQQYD